MTHISIEISLKYALFHQVENTDELINKSNKLMFKYSTICFDMIKLIFLT